MTNKESIIEGLKKQLEGYKAEITEEKVGTVIEVGDGVARLSGLSELKASEMIEFDNDIYGVALNLEEDTVGAVILGDTSKLKEGDTARSTGRILSVPVGEEMVGRVVDPLGRAIDGKGEIKTDNYLPIEKVAPGVMTRKPVNTPLQTGIKAIDSMIPIGRGQRELIIGDRQTGKTAIAVDTIINQKGQGVKCVYVAIGQKESKVAKIVSKLEESGAMEFTTVVVAGASAPASVSYIAPYSGCAIGEYFMHNGEDVLVIYDDLSKHAWAYREVSLLLRRPPGREAYPGDVFYLHSRLLERSAKMHENHGGGSLTALPIIETQAGDVSAYIPTNVISITDGQIFLESDLFYKGVRPALNVGLSVSRVGSAAQTKAMKKVAGKLKLEMAQFRELEAFAQFSSDLDEATKAQIELGKRMVEILKQKQYSPISVAKQVATVFAVINGYLNDVGVDDVAKWEADFHEYLENSHDQLLEAIQSTGELSDEIVSKLKSVIEEYNKTVTK